MLSTIHYLCSAIGSINENLEFKHIMNVEQTNEEATFGAGCFWCVEAIFQELNGVVEVYPGYCGGLIKNPSYREVCNGTTGHAEVARVVFDPSVISFSDLLEVFFQTHDPTTLNRQGADVGTQYRSVIFYHSEAQRDLAELAKAIVDKNKVYPNSIVTAIEPLHNFYRAEPDHHNYYLTNPTAPYCQAVVRPKVEKFRKQFDQLRKATKEH